MNHTRPALLAVIAIALLGGAVRAAEPPEAVGTAAVIRQRDAAWAAAASAADIQGWMGFYGADALVILPTEELAGGLEVRAAVSRLLARPHLSVRWHPLTVRVAASGELAFLTAAYDLSFTDAHGAPKADRGRRLEIWRHQLDGRWQCVVDAWNLDQPAAALVPAAAAAVAGEPTPSPPMAPAPPGPPPAPPLPPASPPPSSAAESTPPAPARANDPRYGAMPTDAPEAIRQYFQAHLKHPDSAQYGAMSAPQPGYVTVVTGALLMHETRQYGWLVKTEVNALNSAERYAGFKTYTFLFRGEKIIDVQWPLPQDEMQ